MGSTAGSQANASLVALPLFAVCLAQATPCLDPTPRGQGSLHQSLHGRRRTFIAAERVNPVSAVPHVLRRTASVLLLLLCLGTNTAQANWRAQVPDAQVIGQGELSMFGFRIYSARLLGSALQFNAEQPFALELTYHRAISREDLVQASLEQITRQAGTAPSPQQLEQWQVEMQQAFIDVEPGQQITGVFLPGQGCQFYVGEQLQHAIADPLFARAFFAIWLAADTSEPELRKQLLGYR